MSEWCVQESGWTSARTNGDYSGEGISGPTRSFTTCPYGSVNLLLN